MILVVKDIGERGYGFPPLPSTFFLTSLMEYA